MPRVFLFILVFITGYGFAQDYPGYRDSPLALATYKHGETYLKVTFGKPFKRGRTVFGAMVPYGRVWRTGANEATEFTTTEDIYFGPKFLKAGTYSLFTVPGPENWIIILNKKLGQFGAFEYDRKHDILRIVVPRFDAKEKEDFTVEFRQENTYKEVNMILWWDKTEVPIPIKFLR